VWCHGNGIDKVSGVVAGNDIPDDEYLGNWQKC
jgi:hypothetical protein